MSVGNQPSLNLSGIIALALIASLLSRSELKRSPIPVSSWIRPDPEHGKILLAFLVER